MLRSQNAQDRRTTGVVRIGHSCSALKRLTDERYCPWVLFSQIRPKMVERGVDVQWRVNVL